MVNLHQSSLALRAAEAITFDNYYGKKNQHIIAALQQLVGANYGSGDVLYLYGSNSGKSHLMQATCNYAHTCGVMTMYVPLRALVNNLAEVVINLESMPIVCVDDVHMLANNLTLEQTFFYFYHNLMANNGKLLLTAPKLPHLLQLRLPDLVSRLMAATSYGLDFLDDSDKIDIITRRAADLGMVLSDTVVRFILTRGDRNLLALMRYLEIIERESLRTQRSITIPFVREVLQFNNH